MKTRLSEMAVISTANKVTGGGAAVGFLGFVSQINWIGLSGALLTAVSLLVSVGMQIRRDRREAQESAAREARESAAAAARERREQAESEARIAALGKRRGRP